MAPIVAPILYDADGNICGSEPFDVMKMMRDRTLLALLTAGFVLVVVTVLDGQQVTYLGQTPPGDTAEVFAPGIVDTNLHSSPVFSPSGDIVLWSVMGDGGIKEMRLEGGRWTSPRPPPFAEAFADGGDSPVFAPDGSRLYFVSHNSPGKARLESGERIWFVESSDSGWSEPEPLDPTVEFGSVHWQIGVSGSGNIVFTSVRDGVIGRYDLFVTRLVRGRYTKPENLGRPINHEYSDATSYLDPDERYMIYASVDRHGGYGEGDLYVSLHLSDGSWGEPINLGGTVNSPSQDLCPTVSPDGRYLFFISMRSGNSQAYWVDMSVVRRLASSNGARWLEQ